VVIAVGLTAPDQAEALRRFVPREHPTIQAAIDAATPGDTIWVAPGVYRGSIVMKKRLVLFGDGGPDSTILDGGDSVRVLHVEGVKGGALIGFGIRGGKSVAGGGVYLLRDTTFSIDACSFRRNWESAVAAWECREIRVANSRFEENQGSAMQWNETTGFLRGCQFVNNKGKGGGGISLYHSEFLTPVRDCTFDGNRAEKSVGGAVGADSSRATFSNCTFLRNTSVVAGGAVAAMARSQVVISRSVLRENRAAQAGALHADASQFLIGFSIFDSNRATAGGSAIGLIGRYDANINPIISNNTFYKNASDGAGATLFAVKISPEIRKNIFVVEGAEQLAVAGLESSPLYACNLIHDPAGGAIGSLPSRDTFVGDPLFCNASEGNFDLSGLSPALRAPCGPIGARKQGCSSFKVQPSR
jgi:hypothetical protein